MLGRAWHEDILPPELPLPQMGLYPAVKYSLLSGTEGNRRKSHGKWVGESVNGSKRPGRHCLGLC